MKTAINRSKFFVGEPPLEEELLVGPSSFHLLEGRLDSFEHRSVVLAHGNALRRQMRQTICPLRYACALLEFEASQVAQVAQAAERVLYLLGGVKGFLGQAVEQAHDLLTRAVLLGKLDELGGADRIR